MLPLMGGGVKSKFSIERQVPDDTPKTVSRTVSRDAFARMQGCQILVNFQAK
jgi:hypothetical protein